MLGLAENTAEICARLCWDVDWSAKSPLTSWLEAIRSFYLPKVPSTSAIIVFERVRPSAQRRPAYRRFVPSLKQWVSSPDFLLGTLPATQGCAEGTRKTYRVPHSAVITSPPQRVENRRANHRLDFHRCIWIRSEHTRWTLNTTEDTLCKS